MWLNLQSVCICESIYFKFRHCNKCIHWRVTIVLFPLCSVNKITLIRMTIVQLYFVGLKSKILLLSPVTYVSAQICIVVTCRCYLQHWCSLNPHIKSFLSVCVISERAVQERDPEKVSWRTFMRMSLPLNILLLQCTHVPVATVRHDRLISLCTKSICSLH